MSEVWIRSSQRSQIPKICKGPRRLRAALMAAKQRARERQGVFDVPAPPASPRLVEGVDVRSPEFLQTWAWKRIRYQALKAAKGRCECCGASPQDGARLNVDHIQPRRKRPDLALDPYNLQVLCGDCNAGKGNWDASDWRYSSTIPDEG